MTEWHTTPRRAVLIATVRSGSSFLAECLDNHPQIGCMRGEPLHPERSRWLPYIRPEQLMPVIWSRPGYRVNIFRAIWLHMKDVPASFMQIYTPKVIQLTRWNALRAVVSRDRAIQRDVWNSHEDPPTVEPICYDPEQLIQSMRVYRDHQHQMEQMIAGWGLPSLTLDYHDLMGSHDFLSIPLSNTLCDFLDVSRDYALYALLKRQNPEPLDQIIDNWTVVERAIRASEFADLLDRFGVNDG